jgi:hypothetical protein
MKSDLMIAIGDFVREAHFTCSGVHDFILNSELYAPAESKILSCLSVISGDYPAELFSTLDRSLRFGCEVGIEDHPRLRGLNIPPTGSGGSGYPVATKTLLIVGTGDTMLALNKATGEQVGTFRLNDANGEAIGRVTGTPMTYMHEG